MVVILCKIELSPCPNITTHHDFSYILSLTQEVFDDEKQFLKFVVVRLEFSNDPPGKVTILTLLGIAFIFILVVLSSLLKQHMCKQPI